MSKPTEMGPITPVQGSEGHDTRADQALSDTDLGLVRVLEDLIDVLISKGVLQFTELPAAAQAKLLERRTARAGLQDPLRLLGPDNDSL